MKCRILLRPLVPADLLEITSYLSTQSPDLDQAFLENLHVTLDWLAENPGAGSPKKFRSKLLAGLRTWPVRGFPLHLIFYRKASDAIIVVGVIQGNRNLPKILRGRS